MYTVREHLFHLYSKDCEYILSELQVVEKQVLKKTISVHVIDVHAEKLSDNSYPITKSSNWTAVIGYPCNRATVTQQLGTAEPIMSEHLVINLISSITPIVHDLVI